MKKQLILAAVVLTAFSACSTDGFKKTSTGLKYKMFGKGEGKKPKEGDVMSLEMSYSVETMHSKDSVIFDTKKQGGTIKVPLQKESFKGGLEEGFGMLSVGDSAMFKLPVDSLFEKTFHAKMPAFIKKGSEMTFQVKLVSLQTKEELDAQMKVQQEAFQKQVAERKDKEPVEIAAYIKTNKITVKPTASGLYYIQTKAGSGPQAADGKTVKVNYVGRFLDGRVFDTSIESVAKEAKMFNANRPYEPIEIKIGQKSVIPGWEEGLKLMKQGGKANLLLPSSIAYGSNGAGGGFIPPYAPLVFEVELVSVQ